MTRPLPPVSLTDGDIALGIGFEPAPELLAWIRATFIDEGGELENEEHAHLRAAQIGVVWTNAPNSRGGKQIVGQAEFKPPSGSMGKWARARAQAQLNGWFGEELDFLLTFDAGHALRCTDPEFCALVEHELFHCGQAKDEFGAPKFNKDSGLPVFCLRPHDIEEFTGVVARYGADAAGVRAFIEAARNAPQIDDARIAACCGTCRA